MVPDVGLRPEGAPAGGARRSSRKGSGRDDQRSHTSARLRIACTRRRGDTRRRRARPNLVVATAARVGPGGGGLPPDRVGGGAGGRRRLGPDRRRRLLHSALPRRVDLASSAARRVVVGIARPRDADQQPRPGPARPAGTVHAVHADGRHRDRGGVDQHRRDRRHRAGWSRAWPGSGRCCRRCARSDC